jgi:hypothetical protein
LAKTQAGEPAVVITSARVDTAAGEAAARIDLVQVGGGEQVVTVDGTAEVRTHPLSAVYQVRLLSPDKFVPDQLRDAGTYEEACALGCKYAAKMTEHAARVDELAADLQV